MVLIILVVYPVNCILVDSKFFGYGVISYYFVDLYLFGSGVVFPCGI